MNLVRLRRSAVALAVLACLTGGVSGCGDSPTAPSSFAPFTRTDLRVGTGLPALVGSVVTVHYTGWIYDPTKTDNKGPLFDTSVGGDPFSFTLGSGQVITGWDLGVVGMLEGGLRRIVLPPSLAYGQGRNSIIPPNATLVFDIDLVTVQ